MGGTFITEAHAEGKVFIIIVCIHAAQLSHDLKENIIKGSASKVQLHVFQSKSTSCWGHVYSQVQKNCFAAISFSNLSLHDSCARSEILHNHLNEIKS